MQSVTRWFSGIRGKLMLLVLLPAVIMSAISWQLMQQAADVSAKYEVVAKERLPAAVATGQIRAAIANQMRFLNRTMTVISDPTERQTSLERFQQAVEAAETAKKTYEAIPRSAKMAELYKPIEDNWDELRNHAKKAAEILAQGREEDVNEASVLTSTKIRPVVAVVETAFHEMDAFRAQTVTTETDATLEAIEHGRKLTLGALLGSIALLIGFGTFIATRLSSSLTSIAQKLGSGGDVVSSASTQLSSASQMLSSGATQAASSLEETVASVEELSSMVKLNADNAKEAATLSGSSRQSAEAGEAELQRLITAMAEITASSKRIEEIINVIDDIAFQTNLLALNAAVEAARAGEQGKGFAVVADAVRTLALRSSVAAKDINGLIKDSVVKIGNGSTAADRSGAMLKTIVTSVKRVAELNSEISSASLEQSNGLMQISQAMNELDQATQRNASSSEEVAASAQEMSAQAVTLQALVSDLKLIVDGSQGSESGILTQTSTARSQGLALQAAMSDNGGAPLAKVVSMRPRASSHKGAPQVMDSHDEPRKVGTTDGF